MLHYTIFGAKKQGETGNFVGNSWIRQSWQRNRVITGSGLLPLRGRAPEKAHVIPIEGGVIRKAATGTHCRGPLVLREHFPRQHKALFTDILQGRLVKLPFEQAEQVALAHVEPVFSSYNSNNSIGVKLGSTNPQKPLDTKRKNRTVSVRFFGCGGGTLNILASLGASCTTFGDIFLLECNLQRFSRHSPHAKRKAGALHLLFVLVAGVGLEPHDLRVMSPTSYQLLYPAIY